MARSHFSFQKRQKELAKQKKREEKLARRAERKDTGGSGPEIAVVNEFGEVIEVPEAEADPEDSADDEDESAPRGKEQAG